jgi:immunity protein 53 of polymorphic toxin system
MTPVEFLQSWYLAQCNDEWEHTRGVTVESLDNPGWQVTIDLIGTPLENETMPAVRQERSPRDWLVCEIERNQFRGAGDGLKFIAILEVFQNWASKTAKVE